MREAVGRASEYAAAAGVVGVSTAIDRVFFGFGPAHHADVVMVYLLGVVVVAMRYGYGPSLFAALGSGVAFDFFFIPPVFSLAVYDVRHVITFAVMLFVAVLISHLTKRIRDQADAATAERTRLLEEAHRAAVRAETEQLRNALLSSVSHDLRTPLAVVTGATSALLDHPPREEQARRVLLETARDEAERLNRLVRNLLDMTRLEAGALRVKKELQPLEEVVGAALNLLEDRVRDRPLDARIPPDLPLVPIDSVLLAQVLINLIENATRHTPQGTPIDIAAAQRDGYVEVEVSDRGPGIAPADAERVFDKFQRLRETEGGGVGLGLTICRGIVRAHGGNIWVEPRDGGGASFRFTLPLATAEA